MHAANWPIDVNAAFAVRIQSFFKRSSADMPFVLEDVFRASGTLKQFGNFWEVYPSELIVISPVACVRYQVSDGEAVLVDTLFAFLAADILNSDPR